jgi:hypothetical protein
MFRCKIPELRCQIVAEYLRGMWQILKSHSEALKVAFMQSSSRIISPVILFAIIIWK